MHYSSFLFVFIFSICILRFLSSLQYKMKGFKSSGSSLHNLHMWLFCWCPFQSCSFRVLVLALKRIVDALLLSYNFYSLMFSLCLLQVVRLVFFCISSIHFLLSNCMIVLLMYFVSLCSKSCMFSLVMFMYYFICLIHLLFFWEFVIFLRVTCHIIESKQTKADSLLELYNCNTEINKNKKANNKWCSK